MKNRPGSFFDNIDVIRVLFSICRRLLDRRAGAGLALVSLVMLLLPTINPALARSRASSHESIQSPHKSIRNIRPQGTGDLDPSFGNQGIVQISVSSNGTTPKSIAVQSDGKIVVGGQYGTVAGGSTTVVQHSFLLRINTDGSFDSSFGKSGIATFNLNSSGDGINVIKLQSDGNILFCGFVANSSGGTDFMVGRATSSGSIDSGFGTNGFANHSGGQALCMDLAINGESVVGGITAGNLGDVVVLDSTGSTDPNFPHATLLGNVSQLASVTGVLWQFNAGGQGAFGPRVPGQIIVTGLTPSGDVGIGQLAQAIDGTLVSGPASLSTAPGPVSLSVIGGANAEVAWAFSGAFLSFSGNTNSVASASLLDASSLQNMNSPAFLSNPNGGLRVQTINVYNGPQAVDSGGTVFADGDVLLGGSISSSDGTGSVGALGVLDSNLSYTDGTSALILYPQLTGIAGLVSYSTDSGNGGVYLLGMGALGGAMGLSPQASKNVDLLLIAKCLVNGNEQACKPPLDFVFGSSQSVGVSFDPPDGVVNEPYSCGVFINVPGLDPNRVTISVLGNLPPGLTVNHPFPNLPNLTLIGGTPTEAGSFVVLIVADYRSQGCTRQKFVTIRIRGPKSPTIISASLAGRALELIGLGFLSTSSPDATRVPQAGKPSILINGVPTKTKPGPMGADTDLIAPKAGNLIPAGATVTIQVQTPGGNYTNSIVVTRTQ